MRDAVVCSSIDMSCVYRNTCSRMRDTSTCCADEHNKIDVIICHLLLVRCCRSLTHSLIHHRRTQQQTHSLTHLTTELRKTASVASVHW